MTLQERESWLKSNWTRIDNGPDIFIFYLDLANGYGDSSKVVNTKASGSVHYVRRDMIFLPEVSTFIRQTAFSILANHFFKQGSEEYPFHLPYTEPLFSHLVGFFKPYNGIGGFDNTRPLSRKFLGKDGGVYYIDNVHRYGSDFAERAFLMLNGIDPFPFSQVPKSDLAIAYNYRVDIVSMARKFGVLGSQEVLDIKTLKTSTLCLLYRILFAECGETVIVDKNTISGGSVEGALKRCVAKRHDIALFLNNAILTAQVVD